MRPSIANRVRRLPRLLGGAVVATVIASAFAVGVVASPAQAASCSGTGHTVAAPESKAVFTVARNCSDNQMHIYGNVYDTKCDGRSAYVEFWVYNENGWRYATPNYHAGGGCGSSASYDYATGGDFYGQKRVKACVFARSWSDSTWKCDWVA